MGYATETAKALLKLGFDTLGLHRISATCDVLNKASFNVLEKIGMKREGHLKEDIYLRNRWRDSYIYAILEQDWKNIDLNPN
jgi:RimJ/RimL family protein N-acetyltransferase